MDACRRTIGAALVCLAVTAGSGCATYSERLAQAHLDVDGGAYPAAIGALDRAIGAGADDALPSKLGREGPLVLLERGTLLQATDAYDTSARDWSAADEGLEWLDLSGDAIGTIGEYIYSDSAGTYRSPPSERLALNGLNLLNYLAAGDLSGAAVEARRYTVQREYLDGLGVAYGSPLGAYLAGFVFERRGEADRALRYYDEARAGGASPGALREPVTRLLAHSAYRPPGLVALAGDGGGAPGGPALPTELMVVVASGRVPYKVPERIPVGAAVGLAGTYVTGDIAWLDRGIAKFVVYPELVPGRPGAGPDAISVDGASVPARAVDAIAADVRREYEIAKPRIIAAALSRMIARAAASEGVRAAASDAGGWASVAAILVEGTLVALDRPDTRSWTLLPARVDVARRTVAPGRHEVAVEVSGESRQYSVDVPEGGFAVVVVTVPR